MSRLLLYRSISLLRASSKLASVVWIDWSSLRGSPLRDVFMYCNFSTLDSAVLLSTRAESRSWYDTQSVYFPSNVGKFIRGSCILADDSAWLVTRLLAIGGRVLVGITGFMALRILSLDIKNLSLNSPRSLRWPSNSGSAQVTSISS